MSALSRELMGAVASLAEKGVGGSLGDVESVTPGLGLRRFYRVHLHGGEVPTVIARVEAPEDPARRPAGVLPEPPLEPIRSLLEAQGLPVPRSFGRDEEHGIDLLEDVGDESLERTAAAATPQERQALYGEACALIPRLQRVTAPSEKVAAFDRHLDAPLFAFKAEQLIRFGLPWIQGRPLEAGEANCVREAFGFVAEECASGPARLSHRDFKAANLHRVRDGAGGERLVMIDLQGAFLAPPEYDLVCLLHDSHVPLPLCEIDRHLAEVRPALPDAPSPADFSRRFHLLTLTRVSKDLSLYLYAAKERGDERYLPLLPNALAALRRSSARIADLHPALGDLAGLLHQGGEPSCAP